MADTSAVGTFLVKITAVDKATAILNKVNSQIEKASRPVKEYGAALKKLAAASHLDKLGEGFSRVHAGAAKAFGILTSLITPLKLITGAASVGGMAALVAKFGDYGLRLSQTAARARTSAVSVDTFRNAVDLAGGSADSASEGLVALQDHLTNLEGGRDLDFGQQLRNLHIDAKKANGEFKTATELLPEVADALARMQNKSLRAVPGQNIFGGAYDGIAPALDGGSAGLASLSDRASRNSGLTPADVENAKQFDLSMRGLTQSVKGAGNAVSSVLAPPLTELMNNLKDWINAHRADVIGFFKDVVTYVKGIDWDGIGKNAVEFMGDVNGVAQALGGWKTVMEGFFLLMAANFALKVLAPVRILMSLLSGTLLRIGLISLRMPVLSAALAAAGAWYLAYTRTRDAYDDYEKRKSDNQADLDAHAPPPEQQARFDRLGANRALPPVLQQHYDAKHEPNFLHKTLQSLGIEARPSRFANNNPTNLSAYPGQAFANGSHGRWATYASPEEGIAGGLKQMILDQDRGYDTIRKEITRRSPPGENDTQGMIRDISGWSGIDPDAKMNLRDPKTAEAFLRADIRRESHAVDDSTLRKGVSLGLGTGAPVSVGGGTGATAGTPVNGTVGVTVRHENAPAGVTLSATSSGDGVGRPTVERAMAGS